MNMPIRRKPKHVVNNLENKGSKGGNFGSRFDTLKNVSEGSANDGVSFRVNVGKHNYGKKVWTKSKNKTLSPWKSLNDISNKPSSKSIKRTDGSIFMSQSNNTVAGGLATERRLVNGEQRIWNHISVNEQLNNWISGQKNYKEMVPMSLGTNQPISLT
ncbi:hypothetical protein GBA52_024171 [Prunus armeniaca]|nr:hypothetical protein GBA52_024171 [Prunus armeniaca]